ncbi:MAG: oligosaccharide flippase family protein [Candidatus Colwellbacteria bacterium]
MIFKLRKLTNLRQHGFVRNVATLQAGSFAGSIIQAGMGIIIARLLQPELFGVYALAFGLASMTTLVIGMGIQEAVSSLLGRAYTQRDSVEVENILGFMLKITFLAALIVLAVLAFLPEIAGRLYGNSLIGIYAAIVSVAVMLSSSLFTLLYTAFQVTGRIKSLTYLIVSDQILRYGLSLVLVVAGLGIAGAMSGHLAGAILIFISSALLFRKLRKEDTLFPGLRRLLWSARNANLKKYFSFTFWVALDRNMGNVFMTLPVILTGIYVTASEVSFFKLAFGYVNLALSLLGPISVLLNVEFPKIQVEDRGKLISNFKKISLYSVGLSVALTVAAIVVSPLAFRILYGESFLQSVQYVFGLVVYGALFGIGVGLGPMWRAINKVKVSILINTIILAGGIPLGLWLIKNYGLWGSVIMVTVWFTVSHFASFIYLAKQLKKA